MTLTAQELDSLPPFVAAVLSECPEPLARQQPPPRQRQRQHEHQRQQLVAASVPQCLAVPVRLSEADRQRTLSDALAIRRGAMAGESSDPSASTPFWLEAGMRPAINRLCSVVLHAVGTGQLDLLRKCQASADQLQAHFRIPPWQSESRPLYLARHSAPANPAANPRWPCAVSAVQRHVTTGIWLLTNCGTDGLRPDQVKDYGEPDPAEAHSNQASPDPCEWDTASCSHVDVPAEAGEVWPMAVGGQFTHQPGVVKTKPRVDPGSSSRRRRSRRGREPKGTETDAAREARKSRPRLGPTSKRSRRSGCVGGSDPYVKSRRRHRRTVRRGDPMEILWPIISNAEVDNTDGLGYVKGPPEPEQHQDLLAQQQEQQLLTLLGEKRGNVPAAARVMQTDDQMMLCGSGGYDMAGAEGHTQTNSNRSTSSPTNAAGPWQHLPSRLADTVIASRTSSSGGEETLPTQKTNASPSIHTSIHTAWNNSGAAQTLPATFDQPCVY